MDPLDPRLPQESRHTPSSDPRGPWVEQQSLPWRLLGALGRWLSTALWFGTYGVLGRAPSRGGERVGTRVRRRRLRR